MLAHRRSRRQRGESDNPAAECLAAVSRPGVLYRGADQFDAANSLPVQAYCPWFALAHPTIIGIVFQQSLLSHAATAVVANGT